jgi:hypothetical protein
MKDSLSVRIYRSVAAALAAVLLLSPQLLSAQQVSGSQLRILDSAGLMRATRVVRESGNVRVTLQGGAAVKGECVAANLDGLAAERKVPISTGGECSFEKLTAGSWQLRIPSDARWRAQIYE